MTQSLSLVEIQAPKIDGSYPERPAMSGAWNAAYVLLSQARKPMDLQSLARVMHALHPDCSQATAENMLHKAAREALLVKGSHNVGGRERTTVRLR